jgi:hypothetical protein
LIERLKSKSYVLRQMQKTAGSLTELLPVVSAMTMMQSWNSRGARCLRRLLLQSPLFSVMTLSCPSKTTSNHSERCCSHSNCLNVTHLSWEELYEYAQKENKEKAEGAVDVAHKRIEALLSQVCRAS